MRTAGILISLVLFANFGIADQKEIRIGYIAGLSGPAAYFGFDSTTGAKMAADDLKSQGIPVSLFITDHGLVPRTAVTESTRLLDVVKVDAISVEFTGPAVAASTAIFARNKLFFNMSTDDSLSKNPYTFTTYIDYRQNCKAIGEYWKKKGLNRIGAIILKTQFAELCLKGFKEVYPDPIVKEHDFNDDVRSSIAAFKNSNVEAILNPGLEGDIRNMFAAMKEIQFKVPVAVSKLDTLPDSVVAEFKDMLNGSVSFGFPSIDENFIKRYLQLQPERSRLDATKAAIGYTWVTYMANAIKQCGEDALCQVKWIEKLSLNTPLKIRGWVNRRANYGSYLESWKDGIPHRIEE